MERLFAIVAIFLLATFLPQRMTAAEADPARRTWMAGYEAMTQADQSSQQHADLAALHGYEKALEVFQRVQRQYPGWNASLIAYRVEYCQKRIAEIKEANQRNIDYLSKQEIFEQLSRQEVEMQALKERQAELQAELQRTQQALERARAEASSAAADTENLRLMRKDRDALAAQLRALTGQLNALKAELEKARQPSADTARVEELSGQLRQSQASLAETGRRLEEATARCEELRSSAERSEKLRKSLEVQLQQVTGKLNVVTEQHDSEVRARVNAEFRAQNLQKQVEELSGKATQLDASQENLLRLKGANRALQERVQSLEMELLNVQRRLGTAETAATQYREQLDQERMRGETNAAAVSDRLAKAEEQERRNWELLDQNARQASAIETQQGLLARLEATVKAQEKQLQEYATKNAELRAEISRQSAELQQLSRLRESADGIAANAQQSAEELAELRGQNEELTRQVADLQAALAKESAARKSAEESLTAKATTSSDDAVAAKIWQERAKELQGQLADAQARLQESESARARLTQEKAVLGNEMARTAESAQKRQQELEAALVKRDQELRELRNRVAEGTPIAAASEPPKGAPQSAGTLAVPVAKSASGEGAGDAALTATDRVVLRGFLRQAADAERAGKSEAARWNYEHALLLQPENFLARKRLGLIAAAAGDDVAAAQHLAIATKNNPDDAEVLVAFGFAQLRLRQPEWALATLSRAAALRPKDAQVARLFGVALSALSWREAASIQLKKALTLDEHDAESAFNLAMIGLTRASELDVQARKTPSRRAAFEELAREQRIEAMEYYRQAVKNGAQEDPALEKALGL